MPLTASPLSSPNLVQPRRLAVVGAGHVGSTFAHTLLLSGVASEIVLIDADRAKAEGEVMDLNHALSFSHATRIWAGDYGDCHEAAITVPTAGAAQKPGESRLDLLRKHIAILGDIVPAMQISTDGLVLVATNPVDVITYAVWKLSGLPPQRVIGSGTILDTARFRYLLSQHFKVDPHSVHAYIIGEHGDSEVPVWSLANIAGMHLPQFCAAHQRAYDQTVMDEIFRQTRDAAYHIIQRKGSTYYAVAAGLMRIVEAMLRDQSAVPSVSSLVENYQGIKNVCLSLPTIINRSGIEQVLRLELDSVELAGLHQSAQVLQDNIQQLGL